MGNKPALGAVAVIRFEDGSHHVTFVAGTSFSGRGIATLGGNQGRAHEVTRRANRSCANDRKIDSLTDMDKYMRIIALLFLFCSSQLAHAFKGELQFKKIQDGVTHTARLSNWSVDNKGVPSFDYSYHLAGLNCAYDTSGKAVAGFDEHNGKVELQVYNPEDKRGRELDAIVLFYNDAAAITLPLKESKQVNAMSFVSILTKYEL